MSFIRMRAPQRRTIAALCLAAAAFVIYNANLRLIGSGDTFPARYTPLAIWRTGTLHLEAFDAEMNGGYHPAYWVWKHGGHDYSGYPIVTPVLITPLYAPAAWYLSSKDWNLSSVKRVSAVMEKLCASLIAAASVAVLYLVLLGIVSPRTALLLTIAYAFGTNTWMTSSQGLWQHGLGELLLATVLYAAQRAGQQLRWSCVAGVCCAFMLFNRPADGIMVIAVSGFFLRPRTWKTFVLPAAAVGAAFLLYNMQLFGSVIGGYSRHHPGDNAMIAEGMAGLLVSPAKGLFVFSPFLTLLIGSGPRWFKGPAQKRLAVLLILGLLAQLVVYGRVVWHGGFSFGPRHLSGLLPVMIWLIAPLADRLSRSWRWAFATLVALAICGQLAGAFYYPSSNSDQSYESEPWTLWHPSYNTVITDYRSGRMPFFHSQ